MRRTHAWPRREWRPFASIARDARRRVSRPAGRGIPRGSSGRSSCHRRQARRRRRRPAGLPAPSRPPGPLTPTPRRRCEVPVRGRLPRSTTSASSGVRRQPRPARGLCRSRPRGGARGQRDASRNPALLRRPQGRGGRSCRRRWHGVPRLLDYAVHRQGLAVIPPPWSRTYYLVILGGSSSLGTAIPSDTAAFRAALARDAVRTDARPVDTTMAADAADRLVLRGLRAAGSDGCDPLSARRPDSSRTGGAHRGARRACAILVAGAGAREPGGGPRSR